MRRSGLTVRYRADLGVAPAWFHHSFFIIHFSLFIGLVVGSRRRQGFAGGKRDSGGPTLLSSTAIPGKRMAGDSPADS
jgi:hypothetical protein